MTVTAATLSVLIIVALVLVAMIVWLAVRLAFAAIATQALNANTEAFLQLANTRFGTLKVEAQGDLESRKQAIDALVAPIRESLDEVKGKLQQFDIDKSLLERQMTSMVEAELQLRQEAANLTQALRVPQARGRWGEMLLDRVVELAGMQKHCTHDTQETVKTEDGSKRPDLVVYLSGGRMIAVDSKAPLDAYMAALEAPDERERQTKLQLHAQQLRARIKELSEKSYWNLYKRAPEMVVLFVPGEAFLVAALQQDPELLEYGIRDKVLLAGPMTLISLLRGAAYGWREEALSKNAEQIRDIGTRLYSSVAILRNHVDRMGKELAGSLKAYNDMIGSFEHNFLPAARRLKTLGVAPGDSALAELESVDQLPRPATAAELSEPVPAQDGAAALAAPQPVQDAFFGD